MKRLKMQTLNLVNDNIKKIQKLFPSCVTEHMRGGQLELAVDFDKLRQELSNVIVEGDEERYQFTWPGKKQSIVTANASTSKTLRPYRNVSLDFENTGNLYIEGDNLEVLKILREDYLGKVKVIYIDPPYNTGSDFVYQDDFVLSTDEYVEGSGQIDGDGNRLIVNTESNGRFHSDWLNMIYPRLKIAKDFLSEDGVIFISIDDGEVDNLREIADEIFGSSNFIGQTVRVSSPTQNISKFISIMHDYTLVYCKNKNANNGDWHVPKNNVDEFQSRALKMKKNGLSPEEIAYELRELTKYPRFYDFDHYFMCDEKGVFRAGPMGGVQSGNTTTNILHPKTGNPCKMPKGGWRYKEEAITELLKEGKILFGKDENVVPQTKLYLKDYLMQIPKGINFFDTQADVHFLHANGLPFDFPKPVEYIKYLIKMVSSGDDIICDFFSGSATTAHAVMEANADDGHHRQFIMIQLPERLDENSEAFKAGYETICQIGEERIRRAGKKILEDKSLEQTDLSANIKSQNLDIGFRVLKLDSSNMKDVYYKPSDVTNDLFARTEDNIKEDRTDEDLLFQVMLELAVPLSAKIRSEEICGRKAMVVDDNYLIACFDKDITDEVVTDIAKRKPQYFVMRDSSAVDDSVITNFETIFQTYSKDTVRKIL